MAEMKANHESREKKNQVAFEKNVNTDGSYVEIITDPQNNRVEICEYDASGDNVVRVYGTFEKVTPISDDEIDTYIDKINSKYKLEEKSKGGCNMSSFAIPPESIANGKCGKDAAWYVIADTMHIGGTGFISTELAPIISKYKVKHVIIDHGIIGADGCAFSRCPDFDSLEIADSCKYLFPEPFSHCSIKTVYGIGESGRKAAYEIVWRMRWVLDFDRIIKNATLYIEDDDLEERVLYADEIEAAEWICGYLIDKMVIGKDVTRLPVESLAERRSYSGNPPYTVAIHEENRDFIYRDGAIFSTDMRALVFFNDIERKTYVIPDGVEIIGKSAFENCTKLQSVVIPESVTKVEDGAFAGCVALSSVTLPESVPKIGCDAFCDVPAISVSGLDEYQDDQELDYTISEPVFEHQKIINADGSYAEYITDPINKCGEIREYDTEGNFVRTVYFMSLY